jgi:hypothetical protein
MAGRGRGRVAMEAATVLLIRARERIADPSRWVQQYRAVDADRTRVDPTDPSAVRWCAMGALDAEAGERPERHDGDDLWHAQRRLYAAAGRTPEYINDELGHAAVLEMFDEAIRRK